MTDALFTVLDDEPCEAHRAEPGPLVRRRPPRRAGGRPRGPRRRAGAGRHRGRGPPRPAHARPRATRAAGTRCGRAEVVRPGRKVQVAEVAVHDEAGRRLVRATVLAIRRQAVDLPAERFAPADPPPPSRQTGGDAPHVAADGRRRRVPQGRRGAPLRPRRDPRASARPPTGSASGSPWSPARRPAACQRLAAAADFVNGLSGVLPPDRWTYINPDLTSPLHRLPVGEWVALDATTRLDGTGVGTAEADLFDERGRIGRCVQTLLVEPR